jgi:hypothetical protein
VVCRAQLRELGAPEHFARERVRAKRWYALYRGVYAVGHRALTPRSRFIAAVYACGPGALLSHRAAGALQGLIGSTSLLEVTAPRGCKAKPGITIHRPRNIHDRDRTLVAAVPVTTTARTLVDLADVLSEDRLAKALHQAEILRKFDSRRSKRPRRGREPGGAGIASTASSPPTRPSRSCCAARPSGG